MNEKELQRISQQAARVGMNVGTSAEAFRRVAEMSMPTGELANNLPDVDKENDELISRREAINALGAEPEVWINDDDYAMGANNQWHYDVNALKAVPSAEPEQRWIPCSERLPEEEGRYLVTCSKIEWVVDWNIWRNKPKPSWLWEQGVTAWMPLPEPYKGKRGRKE